MSSNPYDILGLSGDESAKEIKAKFRSMAHKHHPDKGGIKHRYQAIQHAYDILGNPISRKRYDECGETEEKKKSPVEDILLGLFSELVAKCQERDFNFIKLGKKLL